jgi:hypothetical protein
VTRAVLGGIATYTFTTVVTAGALLYWLHDGDVNAAIAESRAAVPWDAEALAREAGLVASNPPPVQVVDEPAGPATE